MKLSDEQFVQRLTRRSLLERSVYGVGAAALASLMGRGSGAMAASAPAAGLYPGVVWPRHVAPKAKRVIHLCMAGGPSHLETFDNKPKLGEMTGQPMPESFTKGQPNAQLQNQINEKNKADKQWSENDRQGSDPAREPDRQSSNDDVYVEGWSIDRAVAPSKMSPASIAAFAASWA